MIRAVTPVALALLAACSSSAGSSDGSKSVTASATATPSVRPSLDFTTLEVDRAVGGVVGRDQLPIMAIPLDGGGSGGAFDLRIYGSNWAHEPKLIQTIKTDDGIGKVWIADGRINVRVAHYLPNDSHCCASQHTDLAYAYQKGRFALVSQVTAPNAATVPVEPLASSTTTDANATGTWTAITAPPVANPPQRAYIPHASSADCETDSISSKSDDGDVLLMLSGATYRVSAVDQVDSATWLVTDDMVICDQGGVYKIINKDENGETVEATKVRE